MKRINILTIIFLMAMPLIDFAQSHRECYNTVSYCETDRKAGFTKNMQSLSGAFEQGDTSEVQIIVYKNMEYRISICSPSNPEFLGKFQFKISEDINKGVWKENTIYVDSTYEDENYDTQTVKVPKLQRKRVYEVTEKVRYDNADDEMSQDFVFTSNKTRKLKVKVYVPKAEGEEMSSGLSGSSYACVGLLIEHQPGVISGFSR
jgi:ribosomal protein L11